MLETIGPLEAHSASPSHLDVVYVSLELSRAKWLVTSVSAGSARMSRHVIADQDHAALLSLFEQLKAKAERRVGRSVRIIAIQEAGFDGFWIHRVLMDNAIESHVVESASIAVPRRHRRAKSDAIDGEMLLRTLMAFKRGEPRVCAMVIPPTPEQEDLRRVSRERRTLIRERVEHINRLASPPARIRAIPLVPRTRPGKSRPDSENLHCCFGPQATDRFVAVYKLRRSAAGRAA